MARLNCNRDFCCSLVHRARTLLRRDKEQFIRNLAEEPPAVSLDARDVEIPVPDRPMSEDPPTLTEIREPISKLKGGKAAGICNIPAELLEAGGEPMSRGLHTVLAVIWQSGSIPPDLLRERRREFDRGLLAAYFDLKKAFDSVHRELLWEILRLRGIPTRILGLIASLYTGTESAVKCGGASSLLSQE
ncbi:uncharacterized protein [Penaeus vannamei]|uniref:uncharacterized protein n=1 Tax=Penaeus vannamei TaxID=6689 RepID=UPI00387FA54E